MENLESNGQEKAGPYTWGIVIGICVSFMLWGFLLFFLIGQHGPPGWGYGIIDDIPGESFYSTHTTNQIPGMVPRPVQPGRVDPQHVRERPGQIGIEKSLGR